MSVAPKLLSLISSDVMTFIGNKQTDRQTNLYLDNIDV